MAESFSSLRWRLNATTLLALLIGGFLASLSFRRIRDLEKVSLRRYQEVVHARLELQSLSARLMTAHEEERRRLSRELHDELAQTMSCALVEISSVQAMLSACDQLARTRLDLARGLVENAVASIRGMALRLRPSMLDDLGLVPALLWQAREVSRRTGIKVKVLAEGIPDDLPDEYRTCIYRVVQEALHNAARHARSGAVRITADYGAEHIHVSVRDDGSGFNPAVEKGMGILGMEERVRSVGGAFRIESARGGGTVVDILLPVPQQGEVSHELGSYSAG